MNKLLRLYVKLKCRLEGATAVEYAILVTFIALAIIVAVMALGNAIRDAFNAAATELTKQYLRVRSGSLIIIKRCFVKTNRVPLI